MYKNNIWRVQCVPKRWTEAITLSLSSPYSHSETDMMVMPIINSEESKSLQISNSSKLLVRRSQYNSGLCAKKKKDRKKRKKWTLCTYWFTLDATRVYSKTCLMKFPYFTNLLGEHQNCFLVEKPSHLLMLQKYNNVYSLQCMHIDWSIFILTKFTPETSVESDTEKTAKTQFKK